MKWYEISHEVKDWCSIQRGEAPGGGGGEAELNRTSIFHRMRNIVPLHRSKPLAICVVQHLEYQRNWRRLIRISYLGWVKFYFFPLLAKYSQRARPKRNAYFIHKTISVREKIAQIHTNTQRSYCDVMPLLRMVWNCTTVEWYAASQRLSSHRRVHNKLSRCCTIRIVEYESLWDNLGMSDIMYFISDNRHTIGLSCGIV